MADRLVSVDSETLRFPDVVAAKLAADAEDRATPLGAAVDRVAGRAAAGVEVPPLPDRLSETALSATFVAFDGTSSMMTLKDSADTRAGVFEFALDAPSGYLFHMTTQENSGHNTALLGLGTDHGEGSAILVSQKAEGVAVKLSGNPSASATSILEVTEWSQSGNPVTVFQQVGSKPVRIQQLTGAGFGDGATAAGSTTLTSATALFGSGDVGKAVSQLTSRGEGFTIDTGVTITAVTSATTATMSKPAKYTATGVNFSVAGRVPNAAQQFLEVVDHNANQLFAMDRTKVIMKGLEIDMRNADESARSYQTINSHRFYQSDGAGKFFASRVMHDYNNLKLRVYTPATTPGTESAYTDFIQMNQYGMGFFGHDAVVRPSGTPAAATDPATTMALVNSLRASLVSLGLVA